MTATAPAPPGRTTPDAAPRLVGWIITRNEARTIERAVTSLARAVDVVFVIDSESDDATREIAAAAGAVVAVHPFESYSLQRNWALDQIVERWGVGVWTVFIDADEWLGDDLVRELVEIRERADGATDVYIVPRRVRFDGRVLKYGGFGRVWLPRVWRAGYAEFGPRGVNEALDLPDEARRTYLRGWLEHDDVESWSSYIDKHNRYSTAEAIARLEAEQQSDLVVTVRQAWRDRTARRRFLRQRVWDHLPAKPAIRFVQIYVVFGGFLDGRSGLERAVFEAWQEMCTDLKVAELRSKGREAAAPAPGQVRT